MGRKTPPCPEYEEWTTARYWQFIRSALRKAWMKWPPKFQKMSEGRRTVTGRRHKYENTCSYCKAWFPCKDLSIDHETPAGSLNRHEDLAGFVARLFVGVDKLNRLCKPCHHKKTQEERNAS